VPSRRQSTQLLSEAVQVACEIMKSTGLPRATVEAELKSALAKAFLVNDCEVPRESSLLSEMSNLISRWHLENRYVDKTGKPKSLSWDGNRGSLLRLANEVNGKQNGRRIVESIVKRQLVIQTVNGRWLPKSQIVRPAGLDKAQILRAAIMLRRLLRTVSHNSARRYRGENLLFEVMARVPRLPVRYLPMFKKFVRAQGLTYVRSVDDWLESKNLRKRKRKRSSKEVREAGVIVFAYEEPSADT
jgi:hypothetical protein